MFEIVLFQPEIPPNAGNIIRLCANAGARLHLIEPLGFDLSDRHLARAGLDYHDLATVVLHPDWSHCQAQLLRENADRRFFALTTKGSQRHDTMAYRTGDVFVFGPESRGLPPEMLARFAAQARIRIPMRPTNRSMNLSNAVAVVLFEAWRQHGFSGAV